MQRQTASVVSLSTEPSNVRLLRPYPLWNLTVSIVQFRQTRTPSPPTPVLWNYRNVDVGSSELPDRILELYLRNTNKDHPDTYELTPLSQSTFCATSNTGTTLLFHIVNAYMPKSAEFYAPEQPA